MCNSKSILLYFLSLILFISCVKNEKHYNSRGVLTYEMQVKRGKPHGVSKFYFDDGANLVQQCNYKNGKLNGKMERWYYSGNKEYEEFYIDDKLDGARKAWDSNGNLIVEDNYSDGVLNGVTRKWYPNGQIQIDAYYDKGLPQGHWEYYNQQGVLVGYADFDKGTGTQVMLNDSGEIEKIVEFE